MNDIPLTITGTAVADVRMFTTRTGATLASFRLACNSRRFNRTTNQWVDGDTTYLTVNCWRQLADNVAVSIHRGDPVVATGRLRVREWQTADKSGTSVELEAVAVGHDLSRGTTQFTKVTRELQTATPDPWVTTAIDDMSELARAARVNIADIDSDILETSAEEPALENRKSA